MSKGIACAIILLLSFAVAVTFAESIEGIIAAIVVWSFLPIVVVLSSTGTSTTRLPAALVTLAVVVFFALVGNGTIPIGRS